MARFWILILVTFLLMLLAVTYVSKRASLPEPQEEERAPAWTPPAPSHSPADSRNPRSYAPGATSAALYKCVDGSGHPSFQSQPCDVGSTQAWVRDATPEPEADRAERRRRAQQSQHSAGTDALPSGAQGFFPGGTTTQGSRAASPACRSARAADAAYRRQPLRLVTHDGLRRHGDRVNAACY